MIKSNVFFQWYEKDKEKSKKNIKWIYKFIFILIIICLIFGMFFYQPITFHTQGYYLFSSNWQVFFTPSSYSKLFNSNLWSLSIRFLFTTLGVVLGSSIIGFVLAFLTSYFTNSNIFKKTLVFRLMISLLRTLPVIIFLNLFKLGYSSYDALFLIYIWFTWLWLHFYLTNIWNSLDYSYYFLLLNRGYSRFYAFRNYCWLLIKNKFFLFFIYTIESNLRWTTLLSSIGVFSYGSLISVPIQNAEQRFDELLIPLFFLFFALIFLELIIIFYEKKYNLFRKKMQLSAQNLTMKHLVKRAQKISWTKILFVVVVLSIIIYSFTFLSWKNINYLSMKDYISKSFYPDWSIFAINSWEDNPLSSLLGMTVQVLKIIFLGTVFGIIFGLFSTSKIFNKYFAATNRIIMLFIRNFPVVLLFYLFNPIFNTSVSTATVVLSIHLTSVLSKKIQVMLNNVDEKVIKHYSTLNYSFLWVLINYYLFLIKKELKMNALFEIENTFRDVVFFGFFGGSTLGLQIFNNLEKYNYPKFSAYALAFWFFLIFVSFLKWFFHQDNTARFVKKQNIKELIFNLKNFSFKKLFHKK